MFNLLLQVQVDKGMKEGQKVTFRGEGDQQVRYYLLLIKVM